MQFGEAEEQLDALTPTYNETVYQMLMRVFLSLEAPTPGTHPEWYARHQADSQLWTTRCQKIIDNLTQKLTHLAR